MYLVITITCHTVTKQWMKWWTRIRVRRASKRFSIARFTSHTTVQAKKSPSLTHSLTHTLLLSRFRTHGLISIWIHNNSAKLCITIYLVHTPLAVASTSTSTLTVANVKCRSRYSLSVYHSPLPPLHLLPLLTRFVPPSLFAGSCQSFYTCSSNTFASLPPYSPCSPPIENLLTFSLPCAPLLPFPSILVYVGGL